MQHHANHGQLLQVHRHMIAASKPQPLAQEHPPPPPPPPLPLPPPSQQAQQPAKALRFVTNYGAPHPKRRRIGAACLTCRKRKTACSGERPFCETCKQNKLECAGYSADSAASTSKRQTPEPTSRKPSDNERDDGTKRHRSPPVVDPERSRLRDRESSKSSIRDHRPPALADSKMAMTTPETSPQQASLFSGPRNRMPYFRWLGPTAIMPGFKQMVVKVKRQDASDRGRSSTNEDSIRSPSINNQPTGDIWVPSVYSTTPTAVESDMRTPLNLPFYDTSPMPPSELITHLAGTFFTHLGCNYPFLQRSRFLRDLEEKKVDAILVDAVCALAARFSTHQLLTQFANDGERKANPAEYGHAFAQRAKTALTDTFPCPSVAAAQAALLLAYNEFGEQKDSGLWMYLGIAIRLAQDLGMHKLEGMRYVGRSGPTPRLVKRQGRPTTANDSIAPPTVPTAAAATSTTSTNAKDSQNQDAAKATRHRNEDDDMDEQRAVERERFDTFWAIFFLDRVVSSGTGRTSTLRDKDIELSFPSDDHPADAPRWPAPFPALIRIVHLYGRVADLLNSVKEPSDINPETPMRLADMEGQVIQFYQGLSPRLHFDAVNFQHYMKAGEGTNFVLLHFWFHTLIILLHQPTLLKTFEGPLLRLFPNSQQLAMSSAKSIADILSYSQLMDMKASLGNPFTTQPIYIAACAFLKEMAAQTASSSAHSRATSPGHEKESNSHTVAPSSIHTPSLARRKQSISSLTPINPNAPYSKRLSMSVADLKSPFSKQALLATAASQHYQLCYKALQSLEMYWAGTKYILTVLDQKLEGVGDPLLYTTEEGESSMEEPKPEPAFTSPGWRKQFDWAPSMVTASIENMPSPFWKAKGLNQAPESPLGVDPSNAIGWTLTGTIDSPSTNLAWHYASGNPSSNTDPDLSSVNHRDADPATSLRNVQYPENARTPPARSRRGPNPDDIARTHAPEYSMQQNSMPAAERDASLAMSPAYAPLSAPNALSASYQHQHQQHQQQHQQQQHNASRPNHHSRNTRTAVGAGQPPVNAAAYAPPVPFMPNQHASHVNFFPGDMMIESQDVDMSMLGLDMMPWFDPYPTHDMMSLFDSGHSHPGVHDNGNGVRPE